jgi:hypothetical protein
MPSGPPAADLVLSLGRPVFMGLGLISTPGLVADDKVT